VGQKKRTNLDVGNLAAVCNRNVCDMSKVSEGYIVIAQNLHSEAFKYFLPNLHKYSPPTKFCQI